MTESDDVEAVVRRYFATVADLGSTPEALRAILDPAVRVIEHPNPIAPTGAVRDLDGVLAGFAAGKRLLATQRIDVHEVLVAGNRAAVRATWRGTIGDAGGRLPAGGEIVAHIAAFVTVANGRVVEHETFDCYEPLPGR